jgi:hypothetical protein
MSGANEYYQNIASEYLAAQEAIIGYGGLTIIGEETVIGLLNATGGINAQGINTTSLVSSIATIPILSGNTTISGLLYATGGINAQGITTTTLSTNSSNINSLTGGSSYFNTINTKYSSSTGSSGIVTSNTTRGNLMILSGSSTGTVNNSLVNPDTFVSAICSSFNQLNPITYITVNNGSFTVYLTGNASLDIYIKWLIIN